jgi:diguanylate cyclase
MATGSDDQGWKGKFAKLADEYDAKRAEWEGSEKILCRAIVRLSMAGQGLDGSIDPYLAQVRDLVRKGVRSERLLQQLDGITDALIRVERSGKAVADAGVLFQFLSHCAASNEEKAALEKTRERYEAGQFGDNKALFVALLQVVSLREGEATPVAGKPGLLGKLFGGSGGRKLAERVDVSVLRDKMVALLDNLVLPNAEQPRVSRFKEQLLAGWDADNVEGALDDLVNLLFAVKTNIQKEQQEIEEFFSSLTGKLAELENQAGGMAAITEEVVREGAEMNTAVSGHMEELRNDAQGATDLGQLKGFLNSRLDAIVQQLNTHREKEAKRVIEMEKRLKGMNERLQDMEVESGELRVKLRAAHNQALHDALTGLPNRGAYDDRVQQEHLRWRRFGEPLCLLVWDIDFFKKINDRFGHRAGDKAIAVIGRCLASGVRETDFIARYGGEEFVMLLAGADANEARQVAEHLREKIKSCGFNSEGKPIPITVSCGISEFRVGDTPESAFERADQALYQAKNQGRDRCVVMP